LARLHHDSAQWVGIVPLPHRGAAHYREHLACGVALINAFLADTRAADDDAAVLRALQEGLDRVEARWAMVTEACASSPPTLVHGDFVAKNIRSVGTPTGRDVVVLDWETAGWGPIAADLPQWMPRPPRRPHKPQRWTGTVNLDVYAAHLDGAWDGRRRRDLDRLAAVGTVLRCVAGIRWGAEEIHAGGTVKSMERLRWFAEELPHAIAALDDAGGRCAGRGTGE
jgi:aminoglycoside phosphotransferase (APT) family kinase protein